MVALTYCLQRHRRAHQRSVVRALLVEQARRGSRVHPAGFTSPEEEFDIVVESLALRRRILLEKFRSNGKQMVGSDSCIRLSSAAVDFRFLRHDMPNFSSPQEVTASSFKESSQPHEEDSEGNDVESGLGGDSMLMIVEGENKIISTNLLRNMSRSVWSRRLGGMGVQRGMLPCFSLELCDRIFGENKLYRNAVSLLPEKVL